MDSRKLRSFLAVAEELHFRRASERVHITQSGLSQQLRQLESELDVQLLHRTKRRVSLTRAGEVFYREAQKLLNSLDDAVRLARQTASGLRGRLIIGATAPALYIILPEILDEFYKLFPGVEIAVRQMTTSELETALLASEIDVGIAHPPLNERSLTCTTVAREPFVAVISSRNALAQKPALTIDDLVDEPLILFPRQISPQLYDGIIKLCHDAGFSPRDIIEVSPAQSIIALAGCGLGVGFIASKLQQHDRPLVVYRELRGPRPYLSLAVARRSQETLPIVESFTSIAKDYSLSPAVEGKMSKETG